MSDIKWGIAFAALASMTVGGQEAEARRKTSGNAIASYGGLDLVRVVNVDQGYKYDLLSERYEYKFARYLLFSDGSAREALPHMHIDDFNVQSDRKRKARRWSKYRLTNRQFKLQSSRGWKKPKKWFAFQKPKRGAKLNGRFRTRIRKPAASRGDKAAFNVGYRDVQFYRNGRFELVGARGREGGTYKVTNREIHFDFDNGKRRRNSLLFSSAKKKTIFINGRQFVRLGR